MYNSLLALLLLIIVLYFALCLLCKHFQICHRLPGARAAVTASGRSRLKASMGPRPPASLGGGAAMWALVWAAALCHTACAIPMERPPPFSLHHDSYRSTAAQQNAEGTGIVGIFAVHHPSVNISHVVVERNTGRVYVGGVNWLYQLNASLFVEASAQTGPVQDSRSCSAAEAECQAGDARLTSNFNKVLLIDHSANRLIACGSVRQGSCRRHDLADITRQEPLVEVPVAANDQNSSTVAFIGPSKWVSICDRL